MNKTISTAVCGGELDMESGQLESPNYPEDYQPNKECIWRVSVPVGFQVALKFQSFEVRWWIYFFIVYIHISIYNSKITIPLMHPNWDNRHFVDWKSWQLCLWLYWNTRRRGRKFTQVGCLLWIQGYSNSIFIRHYNERLNNWKIWLYDVIFCASNRLDIRCQKI